MFLSGNVLASDKLINLDFLSSIFGQKKDIDLFKIHENINIPDDWQVEVGDTSMEKILINNTEYKGKVKKVKAYKDRNNNYINISSQKILNSNKGKAIKLLKEKYLPNLKEEKKRYKKELVIEEKETKDYYLVITTLEVSPKSNSSNNKTYFYKDYYFTDQYNNWLVLSSLYSDDNQKQFEKIMQNALDKVK